MIHLCLFVDWKEQGPTLAKCKQQRLDGHVDMCMLANIYMVYYEVAIKYPNKSIFHILQSTRI